MRTKTWLAVPFHKGVCKVTDEEFERAKSFENSIVLTQLALGDEEIAIPPSPVRSGPWSSCFSRSVGKRIDAEDHTESAS